MSRLLSDRQNDRTGAKRRPFCLLLTGVLAVVLAACATVPPDPTFVGVNNAPPTVPIAPDEVIRAFEAPASAEYLLGPGDLLELVASQWPEVTGEYVVSPDGTIAVYLAGGISVSGLTRAGAEELIRQRLSAYYTAPAVTLRIKSYENNQIIAMGRVTNPGLMKFKGRPTLLEALARSGISVTGGRLPETCSLIRGKESVVWIDLERLLKNGAANLNISLANNDILYIPDLEESNVFVLGEVARPGAYALLNASNLVSAISQAGGPTEDADTGTVHLVRNKGVQGASQEIDLGRIIHGDYSQDYHLKKNDIVYVPRKGIATLGYYLRQLNTVANVFIIYKAMTK